MPDRGQFVIFDVCADMAHFRRQYAITTALTYAIPPRTALCGLVGAILGLPKNECLEYFGDEKAVFGLQIVRPVRTGHVSINLVDTKDNPYFRLKPVNPRTPMRYEIIRDSRFRIMFSHATLGPKVEEALSKNETAYTPCLGLAWMIAWFEGRPRIQHAEIATGDGEVRTFISPLRSDDIQGEIRWKKEGLYQRVRMPAVMQPNRQVTRYQEYIVDTTGTPIEASLAQYWRFDDGTCFSAM